MKKIVATYKCDVCGAEQDNEMDNVKYPVLFHTDQTEGRSSAPYISYDKLDLCKECMGKVLRIDGNGAQGHNEYKIRK